jgi:two-component SAPR family response regulator
MGNSISDLKQDIIKKRRIFLLHTDVNLINIFKKKLEKNNFLVYAYHDPIFALNNYKPFFYDLLLLEVRMNIITGFEFYTQVLKIEKIPACFITPLSTYYCTLKDIYPDLNAKCFFKDNVSEDNLIKIIKKTLKTCCNY